MKRDSSFEKKKEKEKSLRFKSNDYTRISSQRYRYFNITAAIIQIIAEYHFSKFETSSSDGNIPSNVVLRLDRYHNISVYILAR